MSDQETLTTDRLLELCRRRLEIVQQLRLQTIEQLEQTARGDAELLLTMLSQKQWLLDELAEIHAQIKPFQDQDPEVRRWSSPNLRQECQRIADEGQAILAELLEMERMSIETMTSHRHHVAQELQLHTGAIAIRNAYNNQIQTEQFADNPIESLNQLSLEG